MPQRVTDAEVKQILATTIDTTPFILAATLQVDAYAPLAGWSPALAKEIERWWAAHLTYLGTPGLSQLTEVRDGDTTVRYARSTSGEGLASSPYGQQVLALDLSGVLLTGPMRRASVHFF